MFSLHEILLSPERRVASRSAIEPFKNLFNETLVKEMAKSLAKVAPSKSFKKARFIKEALFDLETLELKERSVHIRKALQNTLPEDFRAATSIMTKALHPNVDDDDVQNPSSDGQGIRGWAIMPMADYVAVNGLDDIDHSLDVLKEMTKRFTAEFAVRPFFIADEKRTLKHALKWASDKNKHVRRLASEGSRTRLPWGLRLHSFIDNQNATLPILEKLKDDEHEYVRRSVANHLNDLSKDHPDFVAKIAGAWLKDANKNRERLVKHACRGLIKSGHQKTLKALGYKAPKLSIENFKLDKKTLRVGESLTFSFTLSSLAKGTQPLIVDYIVHHQKANGQLSPKVFKLKTFELKAGASTSMSKKHAFKVITTRVYHPGNHRLEVQVNGTSLGSLDFILKS